jgi:phosphoribosylanthranilate isomerase
MAAAFSGLSIAMGHLLVQIYEVQTPDQAAAVLSVGVDHVGSVLVSADNEPNLPLYETIRMVQAAGLKSSLIPLFSQIEAISAALAYYQPDIVHFCEDLRDIANDGKRIAYLRDVQFEVRRRFPNIKIMRSLPISPTGMTGVVPTLEWAVYFEPCSDFFLTDTLLASAEDTGRPTEPVDGFVGITGRRCDWNTAAALRRAARIPVILAGGLSPENVFEGILQVKPAGVDSCTHTNALDAKGRPIRFKKDLQRVKRFVVETRRAEQALRQRPL